VLRIEVILTVLITCAIAIHNNALTQKPHFKQEIFSIHTILDYATDSCETCHYDNGL